MSGDLELEVSEALAAGCESLEAVAERLGRPVAEVDVAVRRSIAAGSVVGWQHPDRVELRLTQQGATEVRIRQGLEASLTAPGGPDLTSLVTQVSQGWAAGQAAEAERREAAQAGMLVGDADRDRAVEAITAAYADNRIDLVEVDRRTALALAATTRADLTVALDDLPRPAPTVPGAPALVRWMRRLATARTALGLVIAVALAAGLLVTVARSIG